MDYYIDTNNFLAGPFEINKPGCYHLTGDVIFSSTITSYKYMIGINIGDVVLDLGCHTISQDTNYTFYNRDLSIVSVQVKPNECHPCPGGVRITNGTLGRCTSSCIITDDIYKGKVTITDVVMKDFEVSGILGHSDLTCRNCIIGPSYNLWRLNYNYDAARALVNVAAEMIANPKVLPVVASISSAMSNLKAVLDIVASMMSNLGYVDPQYAVFSDNLSASSNAHYSKILGGIVVLGSKCFNPCTHISDCTITGLVLSSQTLSSVFSNITNEIVLDPANYQLQDVFLGLGFPALLYWSKLLIVLSETIETYSLPLNAIPLSLRTTLLVGQPLPANYITKTIVFPASTSGIVLDGGKAKIARCNIDSPPTDTCITALNMNKIQIIKCTISKAVTGIMVGGKIIVITGNNITTTFVAIRVTSYEELHLDCNESTAAVIINYITRRLTITANC